MRPTFQNIDYFKDETGSLMLSTHENIKQEQQQQICGRKEGRDEVLDLPIGILQDDTGQVVGNNRTHPIRILSQHNNRAKERSLSSLWGPDPQALRGGNPLPPFHESITSPGYREVLIPSLGS